MKTMLLDNTTWDLVIDSNNNIAAADIPYATAQDVTSALRTFQGEVYYDVTLGVPWLQEILGQLPPVNQLKTLMITEVLKVPDVVTAQVILNNLDNRGLSGQVQFINTVGQLNGVQL